MDQPPPVRIETPGVRHPLDDEPAEAQRRQQRAFGPRQGGGHRVGVIGQVVVRFVCPGCQVGAARGVNRYLCRCFAQGHVVRIVRFRHLISVITLLAFSSQTVAVEKFPCDMPQQDTSFETMSHHMGMHLEVDPHSASDSASDSVSGCCGQALCAQAGCMSLSVAIVGMGSPLASQSSNALDSEYFASYQIVARAALFRPPISR